ncbi:MAG: hypothetical protein ACFFKA_06905 [Candidatus Thorarchaeota archaeon]
MAEAKKDMNLKLSGTMCANFALKIENLFEYMLFSIYHNCK